MLKPICKFVGGHSDSCDDYIPSSASAILREAPVEGFSGPSLHSGSNTVMLGFPDHEKNAATSFSSSRKAIRVKVCGAYLHQRQSFWARQQQRVHQEHSYIQQT